MFILFKTTGIYLNKKTSHIFLYLLHVLLSYTSVKLLQTKNVTRPWEIFTLFHGLTGEEIAEEVASFFNSTRLKSFRKPKSMVKGDINPQHVTQFADLLAAPVTFIFNQALNSLSWPNI